MAGGRPTKYDKKYCKLATRSCFLGSTDEELAKLFEISVATLNTWKKKHPQFLASIKKGKEEADENVARSLYDRAMGYSHKEDKIFNNNGKALVVKTTKHYPPEVAAAIFWLKNRQRNKWRDKQEFEHSGEVGISFNMNFKGDDDKH